MSSGRWLPCCLSLLLHSILYDWMVKLFPGTYNLNTGLNMSFICISQEYELNIISICIRKHVQSRQVIQHSHICCDIAIVITGSKSIGTYDIMSLARKELWPVAVFNHCWCWIYFWKPKTYLNFLYACMIEHHTIDLITHAWCHVKFDVLMQERCSSSVLAMELHLSCIDPLN